MNSQVTLRVGLCACSSVYKNVLGGTRFNTDVPELPTVQLTEITIPEIGHRKAIILSRCHFFLDFHDVKNKRTKKPRYLKTELRLVRLVSNSPGRGWRMRMGGLNNAELERGWISHTPLKPSEIYEGVSALLNKLHSNHKLQRWLSTMDLPD